IDDRANNKTSSELLQLKIIENDYTKAQLLKLNIGENIIGRASSDEKQNKVAVVTNDMEMSREHCLITVEKTNEKFQYILKDCKSTNGTYHNGIKLSEHDEVFISKESQIEIGITLIKLI
ncbi:MAG: FHA domain-containing protein, partial [Bacteroidetes bacterium]|nr:FHA domain-containing protein [Bacteroidota bacterium]